MTESDKFLNKIMSFVDSNDKHFLRSHRADIKAYAKEYHKEQLNLYGVVKRLWTKLAIIIIYLPMLLIDYLISLTTDESYAEARKTTMTVIKRQWYL